MELLLDPSIWFGLLTLVLLEIVLGIDNLIFIAILAEKLPPNQRDKARVIGLSLALFMRLGLLTAISWLVTLTKPIFHIWQLSFSGRDLILLSGGLFLLFKATTELHERMEGVMATKASNTVYAGFFTVVAQIVVLDAVFSLDAVITAVGMVDNLGVMMAAVIISIAVMMFASKPMTRFVNAHPTVVILCLSFLLMIGFSLVAEGMGFHVPKGYLYAAIGFSILIETFNQVSSRNALRHEQRVPLRERTANKVLSLMANKQERSDVVSTQTQEDEHEEMSTFALEERIMVSGVLSLADRKVRSIMTPVSDVDWLDLNADSDTIRSSINDNPHSYFPACRGYIDHLQGVVRAKDALSDLMQYGTIQSKTIRKSLIVPEGAGVISLMNDLRHTKNHMVIVLNEFNIMSGVVTPVDLLEAIAGEFPDEDESFTIQPIEGKTDAWMASGAADVHMVQQLIGSNSLVSQNNAFITLAGLLTEHHGVLPLEGDVMTLDGWQFVVMEVDDGMLRKIRIERAS